MTTIQVAPSKEDCRIESKKVIGVMNGRTFVFELPINVAMPRKKAVRETMIANFCEAIELCSKFWQIEYLLNKHGKIEGGKFYEQD